MPTTHTLKSYDEELNALRSIISQMGGLADAQLANAITALTERDTDLASETVAADVKIDKLEADAERLAIEILARRSPVADDLREIVAALKISTMLERIGDYAKNIAKRTSVLVAAAPVKPLGVLPEMTAETRRMITDALDAYIERDSARAVDVWQRDARVDALYDSLFRELLTYMMESPQLITPCTHLLFIAKNIERVGDQATNVAEVVYFAIEAKPMGDQRPKRDKTAFATAAVSEGRVKTDESENPSR